MIKHLRIHSALLTQTKQKYTMGGPKEHQTTIIGGAQAFAAPQASSKKTGKQGFARSSPSERFYTADGLRVPLYDSKGKRITHARDGRVIAHKISRKRVLNEYIRAYAGDAKVAEMEGNPKWTKNQIGDWITEVETKAFGNGPKGKTMKERKEEQSRDKQGVEGLKDQGHDASNSGETRQGRVTRSMSEELRMLLDFSNKTTPSTVLSSSKKRPAIANNAPAVESAPSSDSRDKGNVTTTNGNASTKRKSATTEPQVGNKKPKLNKANEESSSSGAVTHHMPPPAPPGAASTARLDREPTTATNPRVNQIKASPPLHKPPQQDSHSGTFPYNPAYEDLYLPKLHGLHKVDIHPFLSAFSLDPTFKPDARYVAQTTPVRVLPLPATREHLIVSANPGTGTHFHARPHPIIHTTLLPHRDLENQRAAALQGKKIPPPHRRKKNITTPFLKPGKHGWDYEKHAWGFAGDKDLETGIGHQVDPRDEEKVRRGEMSEGEFRDKYPALRGGLWPCGCEIPWGEDDSEED